jgi:protein-L-isoaspartate(D-aspartate) O-methyltransferase
MVGKLRRSGISNEHVLAAMRRVPRHEFVSPADLSRAYDDVSLPGGPGESIHPPSLVALVMQRLEAAPGQKVLLVGTKCAYCTAVLCEITPKVYVVDYRGDMLELAEKRLKAMGYTSAQWRNDKGCQGWPGQGPFDAILVMCAAEEVPGPLVEQLKVGAHMVIPIGEGPEQTLQCLTKTPDGKLRAETITPPTPVRADSMECRRPRR